MKDGEASGVSVGAAVVGVSVAGGSGVGTHPLNKRIANTIKNKAVFFIGSSSFLLSIPINGFQFLII